MLLKTSGGSSKDKGASTYSVERVQSFEQACIVCGGAHLSQDHWEFMQSMPADPVDMVDDLAKMGVYKPEAFDSSDYPRP